MPFFDTATRTRYPTHLLAVPRWFALQTNPRAESRADGRLRERGVQTFAARAGIFRIWSDREKRVESSLFPGYLFARFALGEVHIPLSVPGVVRVLSTRGIPSPVRDEEMEAIRRLVSGVEATGELPDPADPLGEGLVVVVVAGPFQGLTGTLLEVDGATRVAVRIPALKQARSIRMDREMVRPLPGQIGGREA